MTLSDGDVAVLAGQAVGLLDADVNTTIEPVNPLDPYRRGTSAWTVWPRFDKHKTLGIPVRAQWTPADTLARMLRALSEYVGETRSFWAHTFPICPGHEHASDITVDGVDVVFSCPVTHVETDRIRPDVAA